jgi:FkbM family methyltransferase
MNSGLTNLLNSIEIRIVDIGSGPIDGDAPYKVLLDHGLANVIGFEPNRDELQKLNATKTAHERYLPYLVGDGSACDFHICKAPGMSSTLRPNTPLLQYFHGFSEWAEIIRTIPLSTQRLDDIKEIGGIDMLKIDAQGSEMAVLQGGLAKLHEVVVIQIEVNFLPMYIDMPLFAEIDTFLRQRGFCLHRFTPLVSRALQPFLVRNDIYEGVSQIFWTDAVYIRDFTKLASLTQQQLLAMAIILHEVYESWDVANIALASHDARFGTQLSPEYLRTFRDLRLGKRAESGRLG